MNRLVIILATTLLACGDAGTSRAGSAVSHTESTEAAVMVAAKAQADELPLPDVPSSLRSPEERAAYILGHFWDGMVWSDTLRSHDTDFMEQNMVNFINLFQYTDTASINAAVATMMNGATAVPSSYMKVMDVAEKYLYDPNSPMLDEEYYRLFLAQALGGSVLSDVEKTRYRFQESELSKNRRGSKGADFSYIDVSGHRGTLYGFGDKGAMKLVIFYDPECENCAEIIAWLSHDPRVRDMVDGGRLSILGIYPDGDMDEWEKGKSKLPKDWTNGYSPDGDVVEREIYYLRATPTIYLFTPENVVAGKDLTAPQLDAWLSSAAVR